METIDSIKSPVDIRAGGPRPVKLRLCTRHDFMTYKADCDCGNPEKALFAVIGTPYGWQHTSAGDIRTWRSASGARRAAKAYVSGEGNY